jgi:hypothetical protein
MRSVSTAAGWKKQIEKEYEHQSQNQKGWQLYLQLMKIIFNFHLQIITHSIILA